MALFITLIYASIYFVGYYGGVIINLAAGRVLLKNLRLVGLGLVAFVAAIVVILIELNTFSYAGSFVRGYLQGYFAIGPATIVGCFVGVKMWLESRKRGKSKILEK